jgi:membrane protein
VTGDEPGRVERWAAARPARVRGRNPWLVAWRTWEGFNDTRVMGLAAEMAYFALVSLVPLLVTLGAGLGLMERLIGADATRTMEDGLIQALAGVFSPEMTRDVLEPLVRGLLAEERAGLALGGLLVTLWFAGGAFRAVIRALDEAYRVPERRGTLIQWAIAYALTAGAVVVTTVLMALVVVGPLLGVGRMLADVVRLGPAYELAWRIGRWPVVAAVAVAYLAWVYHVGPNVRTRWRDCLPGAVFGTAATLLIATGFRYYLELAGPGAPVTGDPGEAVQIASQTVGAILAAMLWLWLTSMAVLTGGVLNAAVSDQGLRMKDEGGAG